MMQEAEEVVKAFVNAVNGSEEKVLEAVVVPEVWASESDSPRGFFEQAQRKGFEVQVTEGLEQRDAIAVAKCEIQKKGGERSLGSVFLLMEKLQGGWFIAGLSKDANFAKHFANGTIGADFSWTYLLPDARVYAWGKRLVKALREQDFEALGELGSKEGSLMQYFRLKVAEPGGSVDLKQALAFEPLKRYALELETQGADGIVEQQYLLLGAGANADSFELLSYSTFPSVSALLA